MILLSRFFQTLATGELSGTTIAAGGSIDEDFYEAIVAHINLGLIELYKRFNLYQRNLIIHQHEDISCYYLRAEYMGSDRELGENFYIEEDEINPFTDDIVRVINVYDEDGERMVLNDKNDDDSVFTPAYDVLEMTPSDPVQNITVHYQALHPEIVVSDTFDPTTHELNLPPTFQEPLLFYVASRVFAGIKGGSNDTNNTPSNNMLMKYENACKKIELFNLDIDVNNSNIKFDNDGWA